MTGSLTTEPINQIINKKLHSPKMERAQASQSRVKFPTPLDIRNGEKQYKSKWQNATLQPTLEAHSPFSPSYLLLFSRASPPMLPSVALYRFPHAGTYVYQAANLPVSKVYRLPRFISAYLLVQKLVPVHHLWPPVP